jgi:hypothetical protein
MGISRRGEPRIARLVARAAIMTNRAGPAKRP